MNLDFSEMIKLFSSGDYNKLLTKGTFGIELEAQRITPSGDLALTPHPAVFGDKGENHIITTDFSESQIEMITPPFSTLEKVFESLGFIRNEVELGIGTELLWPLSMPPRLPSEEEIPIARFSESVKGQEKEAYRNGLALRYGKKMQMISGIHYNFSFSEEMVDYLWNQTGKGKDKRIFTDDMYFALTRNFLRYRWLLIYLFGASPLCDPTYYSVMCRELRMIRECCPSCRNVIGKYNTYATSLRVSRFGYSNPEQTRFHIYYNSLEEYTRKVRQMIETASSEYSKLGLYRNGVQMQLNGNVLQKESEFYSSIRLKQNISDGETQMDALMKRGVKYIEVRILDLNPFEKFGLSQEQLYFLQVFMLYCLLEPSGSITSDELEKINENHHLTALFGRKRDLLLHDDTGGMISMKTFAGRIFEKLKIIAELMDQGIEGGKYLISVEKEYQKLKNEALLPSERIYREAKKNDESYLEFGIRQAFNNLMNKAEGDSIYENNRLRRA